MKKLSETKMTKIAKKVASSKKAASPTKVVSSPKTASTPKATPSTKPVSTTVAVSAPKVAPVPDAAPAIKIAAIPKGFRSITASITTLNVAKAAEFYQTIFGATITDMLKAPNSDIVLFAQVKIDGTTLMLTLDETALPSAGTGHITLHHYLENIETTLEAALAAGAVSVSPLATTWWGDLNAAFVDPLGIRWNIAKRVERLTANERAKRLQDMYRQGDEVSAQAAPIETNVQEASQSKA